VTIAGEVHAARVGATLLTNAGLPELIATDVDDFVRRAQELAADLPKLGGLRRTRRERLQQSPLCDEPTFVRTLEHAYEQLVVPVR